ncbi:glycosyltransferase family 2 protein [Cohnella kolymensis]|uniref:glycosyltransferase family 2 protein n=1 Tax=Cohnella kolymensis TaxID=1590652 RepID=UPI000696BD94|nr:glycosyltransferase family 2 protein [Cohnella kolymensis]
MKVSVVIPVFNAEQFLSKCLDSVKNQTYNNWEAIAIDDGSSDGSYTILSKYALDDNRFKVSTHANQGPGYTRNRAISQVTGDYVVFLDADDYIDSHYFEKLIKCIEENQSDVVFIDALQEKPSGELIRVEYMSKYKGCSKEELIRSQMTGKMPWGGGGVKQSRVQLY